MILANSTAFYSEIAFLDRYEVSFVEAVRRMPSFGIHDLGIIHQSIRLMERVGKHHLRATKEVGMDFLSMTDFSSRSAFYGTLGLEFISQARIGHSKLFTWRNAAYIFVPLLAQELEGTLKHGLRILAYFLHLESAKKQKSYVLFAKEKPYLNSVMDYLAKFAPSESPLADLVQRLNKDFQALDFRNPAAHSQFVVSEYEGRPAINFLIPNRGFTVDVENFLDFFFYVQHLCSVLNVALHLGARRYTGQPTDNDPLDFDANMAPVRNVYDYLVATDLESQRRFFGSVE